MVRFEFVALLALFVAPAVSAEIFKCAGKNGTDLYQNFPCEFESMGWAPPASAAPPAGGDAKAAKPGDANAERAGVTAGNRIFAAKREPRPGMTTDEVKAIWGEPTSGFQDEVVEGRIEVWSYGPSRSVQFDSRGRATLVRP
jgi:hypothetical protein